MKKGNGHIRRMGNKSLGSMAVHTGKDKMAHSSHHTNHGTAGIGAGGGHGFGPNFGGQQPGEGGEMPGEPEGGMGDNCGMED